MDKVEKYYGGFEEKEIIDEIKYEKQLMGRADVLEKRIKDARIDYMLKEQKKRLEEIEKGTRTEVSEQEFLSRKNRW